jgi:hypothetical protein
VAVSCGTDEGIPRLMMPAPPPENVSLLEKDTVGCYEIPSPMLVPHELSGDSSFSPPRAFRLRSEHTVPMLHRLVTWANAGDRRFAGWRLTGTSELTVFWSDGFTGVTLHLRRRGRGDFAGRAESISDVGGPQNLGEVVVKRIRCHDDPPRVG